MYRLSGYLCSVLSFLKPEIISIINKEKRKEKLTIKRNKSPKSPALFLISTCVSSIKYTNFFPNKHSYLIIGGVSVKIYVKP